MRLDLYLHHPDAAPRYMGKADDKSHAVLWAANRLRMRDTHFGTAVIAVPVGGNPTNPDDQVFRRD